MYKRQEIREEIIKAQELFTEKEYVLTDIYSRVNKLKELGDQENYYLYRMKMNEISKSRNIKSLLVLKEELDEILNKTKVN